MISPPSSRLDAMADPVDISEFLPQAVVRTCKVGRHLEALEIDQDRHARLVAALGDSRATDARIAAVLTSWGYRVSDSVVRTHRREECCCEK